MLYTGNEVNVMADTSNSIDVYGNVIGDSVHFAADKYNVKAG